jgi:hypothetical protein
VLRVSGGATGLWSVEALFDGEGKMFLKNGCRRFASRTPSKSNFFAVFKYDGHGMLTVNVFDETMYRDHYHTDEDD